MCLKLYKDLFCKASPEDDILGAFDRLINMKSVKGIVASNDSNGILSFEMLKGWSKGMILVEEESTRIYKAWGSTGAKTKKHYHPNIIESFYVVKGEILIKLFTGNKKKSIKSLRLKAGDSCIVPLEMSHVVCYIKYPVLIVTQYTK